LLTSASQRKEKKYWPKLIKMKKRWWPLLQISMKKRWKSWMDCWIKWEAHQPCSKLYLPSNLFT
jgi:hypothetical protein